MTYTIDATRRAAKMEKHRREAMCALLKYDAFGENNVLRQRWFDILERIKKNAAKHIQQTQEPPNHDACEWVSMAEAMPQYLKVLQQRRNAGNG